MNRLRPAPDIPDHEVLRKIGGGSYGEVYMARSVTGALRAVKVVWREDFEDDRTFEREFEGILKYEPISRSHPGLVNLLHIGRSPEEGQFYYYVMELGDDCETGADINPATYEARTLQSDLRQNPGVPRPLDECLQAGISLAGALDHLHGNGLAHRDVKPANVIFVDGDAQLADIGLVAATGGRSFVGTEGFVPPEGPGSAQADIYSLGKVLYEMASGKDRLDFPELPDELPAGAQRKKWLNLNKIICDVCDPRLSQRKIRTGAELEHALERVAGRATSKSSVGLWVMLLLALLTVITLIFTEHGREIAGRGGDVAWDIIKEQIEDEPSLEGQTGLLRIQTLPENVAVHDSGGQLLGYTPFGPTELPAGQTSFQLRLGGYSTEDLDVFVKPGTEQTIEFVQMRVEAPPVQDQPWTDSLGMRYGPVGDAHVTYEPVRNWLRQKYEKLSGQEMKAEIVPTMINGNKRWLACVTEEQAEKFTSWLTEFCLANGLLTDEFIIEPEMWEDFNSPEMSDEARRKGLKPFKCKAFRYEFAQLTIVTDPPGAALMIDGEMLDRVTPTTLSYVIPGRFDLQISLDGYRLLEETLKLESGEKRTLDLELKSNKSVVFGKPWKNDLGMEFAPVGQDLMVSVWETRVKDYALFAEETEGVTVQRPPFSQEEAHAAVNITLEEARTFCKWLTQRDRASELLTLAQEYRLPTDLEWSRMAGLDEDPLLTPEEREFDRQRPGVFVWGKSWVTETVGEDPVANLADQSLARAGGSSVQRTIPNYDDGYAFTAPVDTFPANGFGLKNLAGNVHEWVDSQYNKRTPLYVLRGGGWNSQRRETLLTRSRNFAPAEARTSYYGFRVVISRVPMPSVIYEG